MNVVEIARIVLVGTICVDELRRDVKVIAGNRRTGRTTKLIELCTEIHQQGRIVYIVLHTEREVRRVWDMAREMGCIEKGMPFPLTLDEATHYHGADAIFLVDNAELIISKFFPMPVAAISVTTNE